MAKKMSVEEILAAARGGKKADSPAPAASTPEPEAPAAPAPSEPSAAASEPAASAAASAPVKAAPKGGAGMSMADILAAARAKKGDAPAAAAAPAPKAEKPAAPKPAAAAKPAAEVATKEPAKESGPKDTASILAAVRKGAKPGPVSKSELAAKAKPDETPAKKKLEVPPMPAKPAYAQPKQAAAGDDPSRRTFLAASLAAVGGMFGSSLAVGFMSLAATQVMWLLGLARFMFPNILIEPPTRFKVGFPSNFGPGQVETKFIPQFGVWIVRYEFEGQPMLYALKAVCTHLGCTPNWLEGEQKFKCPCHGSGFYKDGVNFEGPAPRPLERYAISLADDGQLEVDKSRTFNQELGQWKDPSSFVPV